MSKGYEVEFGYHRPTANGSVDFLFTYYNADSTDATGQRAVNAVKEAYSPLFKYAFEKRALRGLGFGVGGHFEGPVRSITRRFQSWSTRPRAANRPAPPAIPSSTTCTAPEVAVRRGNERA